MFLEGCRSPSCLEAEERIPLSILRGLTHHFLKLYIDLSTTRSLVVDLIYTMPIKGVGNMSLEGCCSVSCRREHFLFFCRSRCHF